MGHRWLSSCSAAFSWRFRGCPIEKWNVFGRHLDETRPHLDHRARADSPDQNGQWSVFRKSRRESGRAGNFAEGR